MAKKGAQGGTKRGKGTKLMAVADGAGFPVVGSVGSASPHEVKLVEKTLDDRLVDENPERLIGDRAYDSDPLDEKLAEQGILLIAPHKSNRKKPKTQDGRELRRYRRRWKVERLYAWLQNYRRVLVRYDRFLENYLAFVHLACILIFVRTYFEMSSSCCHNTPNKACTRRWGFWRDSKQFSTPQHFPSRTPPTPAQVSHRSMRDVSSTHFMYQR